MLRQYHDIRLVWSRHGYFGSSMFSQLEIRTMAPPKSLEIPPKHDCVFTVSISYYYQQSLIYQYADVLRKNTFFFHKLTSKLSRPKVYNLILFINNFEYRYNCKLMLSSMKQTCLNRILFNYFKD